MKIEIELKIFYETNICTNEKYFLIHIYFLAVNSTFRLVNNNLILKILGKYSLPLVN